MGLAALKQFEGSREAVATVYLYDVAYKVTGAVPLVKIAIAPPGALLSSLREDAVTESNERDAHQRSAPAVEDGLFLVPKVIE